MSSGEDDAERNWGRIVLKLSGEAFAGGQDFGIDQSVVDLIAREVIAVREAMGTEIAIVVGGGNIWRGQTAAAAGLDRSQGDYMGMLATVINSLDLQATLERHG